ncbi:hypothetical protein NBRC116188_17270 [Oceaniserpentilla sp. 4NH20-0058]|uniref:helix-turn-helix domain-containing protein n=1 Tax=Oceaniserpentilla sp. 4NH20-0058 TaxID=3127660 RepID=UPI003107B926
MKLKSAESLLVVIKIHRMNMGMQSRTLAALAGVSAKFMSQLENNKTTVETDTLTKVSQVLGLKMPYLDNPEVLAQAIRQKRKALNLDQSVLASLCNVSPKFLSALENAHPKKRLNKVFDVLNGLGLTVEVVEP